jgi:hypothetical protein
MSSKPIPGDLFNALWEKAKAERRDKDGLKVMVQVEDIALLVELTSPASTYSRAGPGKTEDLKPRPEKLTIDTVRQYLVDGGVPAEAITMLLISEHESGAAIIIKLNGFLDKNWYKVADLIEKGLKGKKYDKPTKQWVIEK